MKFNTYREAVEFFTHWIAECEAQAAPLAGMAAMLLSQKKIEKTTRSPLPVRTGTV